MLNGGLTLGPFLLGVILGQGQPDPSVLDDIKTVAEIVNNAVTALAFVVGAVWAYFRFVKERTYRPRLEVTLSAFADVVGSRRLVRGRITVKNIGTSVVRLRQRGTGLRISKISHVPAEVYPVEWEVIGVFEILAEHAWIEPGESVTDESLVAIDFPDSEPLLLESRLVWTTADVEGNVVVFTRQVVSQASNSPAEAERNW